MAPPCEMVTEKFRYLKHSSSEIKRQARKNNQIRETGKNDVSQKFPLCDASLRGLPGVLMGWSMQGEPVEIFELKLAG